MDIKLTIDENGNVNRGRKKTFFGNQYDNNVNKVIVSVPKDKLYNLYLFYTDSSGNKKGFRINDEFYVTRDLTNESGVFEAYIVSSDTTNANNILKADHVFISKTFKFEIKASGASEVQ